MPARELKLDHIESVEKLVKENWPYRGETPKVPAKTSTTQTAQAMVVDGRWLVRCPSCLAPQPADPQAKKMLCLVPTCQVFKAGEWIPVEWPRDLDALEELIEQAPEGHKTWHPIWSAKDFKKILADPGHAVGA